MTPPRLVCVAVGSAVMLALSPLALNALVAPAAVVSQKGRLFKPTEIAVVAGSTIRFTNDDPFLHQMFVSSPDFSFDSDPQSPGQSTDVVFPTPGDFQVLCGIHPKMKLAVHVR